MCAEGGQLQLNAFEPTIGYCILSSMRILTAAIGTLTQKCITGIEADEPRCRALVENSIGLVTALVPMLGYEACSRVAKRALAENRRVSDVVLEERLLTSEVIARLFCADSMTSPIRRATRVQL
jgi:aspartate ammonia-lyase